LRTPGSSNHVREKPNVVQERRGVVQERHGVVPQPKSVCEHPQSAAFCHKNKHEKSLQSHCAGGTADLTAAIEDINEAVNKLEGIGERAELSGRSTDAPHVSGGVREVVEDVQSRIKNGGVRRE